MRVVAQMQRCSLASTSIFDQSSFLCIVAHCRPSISFSNDTYSSDTYSTVTISMADRPRPDFGNVRVNQKPARWGGPRVPLFSNDWLAMMWNFKGDNESMKTPMSADNLRRIDNLRAFWFSDPNIDDDEVENKRWSFLRPLGDGGFGQVALWVRADQDTGRAGTTPHDYCAVKQFDYKMASQSENLAPGVMKEGV